MINKQLRSRNGKIINGPILIEPKVISDSRGYFYESWNQEKFNLIVKQNITFSQDNVSYSKRGVLRGLHYQLRPKPQAKLVRCPIGSIFDVAVDIRKGSNTFGEWVGAILNKENKHQLWIPQGFAHGFITLSEYAEVNYKASGYWNKSSERSLHWNDVNINIDWPIKELNISEVVISEKDKKAQSLNQAIKNGDIF